ncbi:DNA polymerase III subunit gamma/tau [Halomonas sp. ZH2S]|uniref:DNA polymerase III subunit gamma/tau n=1 Tax=Vreelandella zhuhanensis TaxID=2684210 RepID=A0A7X3KR99_9GAMM|nr:DNA polymerase III subunit gamma/tau [Halomonas zhuhanensis]MWJ27777.1 DNA polymerase III subunit gamma/tau [Halomonas zhuhanensis]
MSYQVLARKWRPRTFHELVGQAHVQRALVNALDQGRLHHAYLFTGTRGVGKTTLARILAKCLNCTANGYGDEGVTSTPCGECDSCQAIDEGRFVDLIEVDAASRTKVEDTRELLDNVQYAPTQGRYKVYLIDEVHMLSTSSFNALLKTLEEPPPHVKFLLATTDPQKLPATVLSRCLQFTLKHMQPVRIVEHLAMVLAAEQVHFEESALWLIGKAADGSMRDAMSLTDQAIAFGQGSVQHLDVAAMLGTLDHRHVLALVEALADIDAPRLLHEVAELAEQGPDFAAVLDDVTAVLHRLAVAQMVPEAVDNGHGDRETILALAGRFIAEDIQLYYQIGIQGRGDMVHAPDLRSALEMTLLRMLAFRPQGVPKPPQASLPMRAEPAAKSESLQAASSPPSAPAADEALAQSPSETAQPASSPPPWEKSVDATPDSPSEPQAPLPPEPKMVPPWEGQPSIEAEAANERTPSTEIQIAVSDEPIAEAEASQATEPGRLDHQAWLELFDSLGLGGLTRNLAAHCIIEEDNGAVLRLRLDPSQAAMQADVHQQRLEKSLESQGFPRKVSFEVAALPEELETPRQRETRHGRERHALAVAALNKDPHVQKLQQVFGAKLIESSVKPAEELR